MTPSQYNEIRERLQRLDADLVLAAAETDQDLLDWFSTLSLSQRLDRAAGMANTLAQLRNAGTTR